MKVAHCRCKYKEKPTCLFYDWMIQNGPIGL